MILRCNQRTASTAPSQVPEAMQTSFLDRTALLHPLQGGRSRHNIGVRCAAGECCPRALSAKQIRGRGSDALLT